MKEMIQELIQYRELLFAFTIRNIKIKYKQTVMGFLWAIFMPIVIVLSGIIIKQAMSIFSGKPMELNQIVSVSVKALPWAFFVGALKFSVSSLIADMSLINKIYFPREIFPLSYTISQLFDFTIATIVFAVFFIFADIGVDLHFLWLPLLLVLLFLFTAGMGLILSCGNLFFRDVKYIVDVFLTFGIFFTPVFYDAHMFGKWEIFLLLNPMGAILENINRVVVLHQPPDLVWLAYAGVWGVFGFFGSWYIFHKLEPYFAENI